MVNLTRILCKYYPSYVKKPEGGNAFLRKQALYKLTYAQHGRSRNCYRLARRAFKNHLRNEQEAVHENRNYLRDLNSQRILAACEDQNYPYKYFIGRLPKLGIELDRQSLASIAIWEPRTFSSLIEITKKYDENDFELD